MGGLVVDLSPRDVELARRAAGGDGAAFVRLYDSYSAEVFETSLNVSRCVERAADATQIAFLTLLRCPPPVDAPDADVPARLRAMALGPGLEHATVNAGAGWLRSETVAKASARFDEDWSGHLMVAPAGERCVPEVAQAWAREGPTRVPVLEGVMTERPLADPQPRRKRRRFRRWLVPRAPVPPPLEPVS